MNNKLLLWRQPEDKRYIFLNDLFCLILGNARWKKPLSRTKAIDSIAPLQTASLTPAKASWEKTCSIQRLKLDCILRTHMSNYLHPSSMKWTSLPLTSGQYSKGNKKWKLWGKNKIVWAFWANCQNTVEEGKKYQRELMKECWWLFVRLFDRNKPIMILKCRLSSFCQKD